LIRDAPQWSGAADVIHDGSAAAMDDETLTNLVQRAKARDPEAFDALIDGYGPRLYGYFYRRVGSRHDAEDLLQELFLRVVRTIVRYEHNGQFEGWLFRIATNLLRDRGRQLGRRRDSESLDAPSSGAGGWRLDAHEPPAPEPSMSAAEREEELDRLGRALGQLSSGEREVLTLRHFSTLSFAQIAEIIHAPLGTVLARSHRGLAKLRAILEPDG
jgi:RNA polymerase sigma-70 factor (ECF subfamily)